MVSGNVGGLDYSPDAGAGPNAASSNAGGCADSGTATGLDGCVTGSPSDWDDTRSACSIGSLATA